MKRASETNENEIMDRSFLRSGSGDGGGLAWSVFGAGRLTPSEVLELIEEGGADEFSVRAAVMSSMLDLCLADWRRNNSVLRVGERCLALAVAVGHRAGAGAGVVALPGAVFTLGGLEAAEVARRILDLWTSEKVAREELGKRVLAFGRFFNHPDLDGWSIRALAKAGKESRTWAGKRVHRLCNKVIEAGGGRGKATWQQGASQRERSSAAQKNFYQNKKNNTDTSDDTKN
jgi:hypothetical protein